MKKLLALLLCLILCLSLFACNKTEELTEAPTETEAPTDAEKPTETDKAESESKEMKISFVKDEKIVFPDKEIEYVKYEYKKYEFSDPMLTPSTTVSLWIDEAIFRSPKKIEKIVNSLKSAELTKVSFETSIEETYTFYFKDNTHAQFQVGKTGFACCDKYLDENGEQIVEYYYIKSKCNLERILGE